MGKKIKDGKNTLCCDKMSCHHLESNVVRLKKGLLDYNLTQFLGNSISLVKESGFLSSN